MGLRPGLRKLVVVGAVLRAARTGRDAYAALERDPASCDRCGTTRCAPRTSTRSCCRAVTAAGMRPYLESSVLHAFVVAMADADKPFAATATTCRRWPGDAHAFATTFADVLAQTAAGAAGTRVPAR